MITSDSVVFVRNNMSLHVKSVCIFILLSHVMCTRIRKTFNPCLFNVFSNFYISENVYFDISSFASVPVHGWQVKYTHDHHPDATLRFTFCRDHKPGSTAHSVCSEKSALACIFTDEDYLVNNAGSRISGPFYRNGELQISLDSGEDCGSATFSVLVRLNCSSREENPKFVSYRDCVVTVLWNTPVGCPIDEGNISRTCVIQSDKVRYDIRPLRHTLYHSDHKKTGHFRVNVCGQKKKDECNTICEYNDHYDQISEHGSMTELSLTGGAIPNMVIRYVDTLATIHAEVYFRCDRGSESHIARTSVQGHVHMEMHSIFACNQELPYTVLQDAAKNSYNISALYHNAHNYKVQGPTEDLNYIFNLGGSVDHMPGIACEGTICLWDSHNNLSVSLGHRQLEPIVVDGFVLLKFVGGGKCGSGSNVHRAIIKLICQLAEKNPELEFITPDCVHNIVWETASACYYKYFEGSECKVGEETYSHFFNLNPLFNKTSNYVIVTPTNEKFYINICGSIVGQCGNFEYGVSICWNNKAIGYINKEPIYYNGAVELRMTGEACRRNGPNSTTIIKFLCEMDIHSEDHNKITLKEMDEANCIFTFVMYTSAACTSTFKKYGCDVTDYLGHEYNFKSLSRTNSNYYVKGMLEGRNVTFILNVCQPVVSGPDVMCPIDAMACLFTEPLSDINRYTSIGKMQASAFKINKENNVELHYTEGVPCLDDSVGISAYETSTVIEFICDHNAKDSVPVFDGLHKCVHRFHWLTPSACPLDSQEVTSTTQQTPKIHEAGKESGLSKVIVDQTGKTEEKEIKIDTTPLEISLNPEKSKTDIINSEKERVESKYTYEEESMQEHSVDYLSHAVKLPDCFVTSNHGDRIDLSPLMKKEWRVPVAPYKNLAFSVCDNLKYKCGRNRNAGSCMENMNTGVANNRLMYQPGKVILNYTEGDVCNKGLKYSTLLQFVCGLEEEMPRLLPVTDDCVIIINFVTPLVCVFDCTAHSVDMKINIDLKVFMSNTHNYHIKHGKDEYIINICRPLVINNNRPLCSDGSAACKVKRTLDHDHNQMSLGYVSPPMVVDKAGSVWLRYVHGSKCPSNLSAFSSAIIHFICSTIAGFGHPEFRNVTDCEYYFTWYTSIVCPNRTDVFDSDTCSIHDMNFTSVMNLSDFKERRTEVRSLTGHVYMLELCRNNLKICNNSQVCRMSGHELVGYGNTPVTTFDYTRNAIHILYVGGQCSQNAHYHASIWLKCNKILSRSSPVITKETDCIVMFEWEDKHFCYYPNKTAEEAVVLSKHKESSSLAGLLWAVIVISSVSCMLAFAFGLWLMDRRNSRLSDLLSHFRTSSSSPTTTIRYSRVGPDELEKIKFF